MANQLWLRLADKESHKLDFLHSDSRGNISHLAADKSYGDLQQWLTQHSFIGEVIVLVPTSYVSLTRTQILSTSHKQLKQAIPYALEENIADSLSDTHFIYHSVNPQEQSVMLTAKSRMQAWLESLKKIGIQADAMIPDIFCVPYKKNSWQLLLDNDHCLIRTGEYDGFVADLNNVFLLLKLKLAEVAKDEEESPGAIPKTIIVHHFAKHDINLESLKSDYPSIELIEKIHQGDMISVMQSNLRLQPSMNLLQGEFRPQKYAVVDKVYPKIIACLGVAILSVAILGKFLHYRHLEKQSIALNHAIEKQYKKIYPAAKTAASAKIRVERELKTLQDQQSGEDFLFLFNQFSKNISQYGSAKVLAITYHDKQLQAEVELSDFEKLRALTHALSQQGLQVKQGNAHSEGPRVVATLVMNHD